ncbi:MAG TPA: branched-chain amino acid ABC transporter permease [Chloroflexota bacterium]|nr:branched-chain amino acid ABC transporter permease [Chloroflexota bacterium]
MSVVQALPINRPLGRPLHWVAAVAVVALGVLIPLVSSRTDVINLLFLILLFASLGQSWNMLGGFTGQVNLGHAAFFGIGVMVTRQLWLAAHWPYALAFLCGGLAALVFGLLIGAPTFRLRGAYFSIGTLGLAEALHIAVSNLLPNINALPAQVTAEYDVVSHYYLALALAVVTTLAAFTGLSSRVGLGWLAVREDEEAARASGVDLLRHKLSALAISSFFAGLVGGVFALHQASFYASFAFDPSWTFDALLITFIGGVGTVLGPLIGALFYILVREQLAVSFTQFHHIIFGVLFILVVLLLPGGLIDAWQRLRRALRSAR